MCSYGHRKPAWPGIRTGWRALRIRARTELRRRDQPDSTGVATTDGRVSPGTATTRRMSTATGRRRAEPCAGLPPGRGAAPPSVPSQPETSWTHPQFTPPLQTFFTVDALGQFPGGGNPTMAPGGLDVYTHDAIPRWKNSVLALSLIRGVVYRLPLAARRAHDHGHADRALPRRRTATATSPSTPTAGRSTWPPIRPDRTANAGRAPIVQTLANPGSILAFTTLMD